MGTRDRAMDAAVELLGSHGLRALTHRRIDVAAGLPQGSTSNHFRTRAQLLQGVVEHLVAMEQTVFDAKERPQSIDGLVDALCTFIDLATGAQRTVTAARLALFVEAIHDHQVREVLARGREHMEEWAAETVQSVGLPEPVITARRVMGQVEGIILHRLALGGEHLSAETEASLRACLGSDD